MREGRQLQRISRRDSARPSPLEVIATEPAGDVDCLADRVEAGDATCLHRLGGQFGGGNAAERDLGFGEAFAAVGTKNPFVKA